MLNLEHGKREGEVYRRILQGIFEQQMPPGARVSEEQLAAAFDVSRTVVRQAMARLVQDGILLKRPNIGTTVASPTVKETRDILAVRRMVEPEIVRAIATEPLPDHVAGLRTHVELEMQAHRHAERGTAVRLSGEFHLLLAELAGNQVLVRLMTGLQALTCLAILLYADEGDACIVHEHGHLVEAIARGDANAAVEEMLHHLDHVESELRLERAAEKPSIAKAMKWFREGT